METGQRNAKSPKVETELCLMQGLEPSAVASLIEIRWKGHSLTPPCQGASVDLGHLELPVVLERVFQNLSAIETCVLWSNAQKMEIPSLSKKDFFKALGHPINPRIELLPEVLVDLPDIFLRWAQDRKLSFGDLIPLLSVAAKDFALSELTHALKQISTLQCSRTEGRNLLDLAVDLILMGRPIPKSESKELWAKSLHKARYPMTTERDTQASNSLKNLPKYVQYRGSRSGDTWVHSLTLRFSEIDEGLKRLNGLIETIREQQ